MCTQFFKQFWSHLLFLQIFSTLNKILYNANTPSIIVRYARYCLNRIVCGIFLKFLGGLGLFSLVPRAFLVMTGFQGKKEFQGSSKSSRGEARVPGEKQEFQGGIIGGSHPVYKK